uniref:(northern house mosquito) hypothetical protein n=1 Tax=Culex pipiens TaxID=7175 RepID=A0A8D8P5E7_CULPI
MLPRVGALIRWTFSTWTQSATFRRRGFRACCWLGSVPRRTRERPCSGSRWNGFIRRSICLGRWRNCSRRSIRRNGSGGLGCCWLIHFRRFGTLTITRAAAAIRWGC